MSYFLYFTFTAGLARDVHAPVGALAEVRRRVALVTEELRLEVVEVDGHASHWRLPPDFGSHLPDARLCEVVNAHNRWVRWFYAALESWARTPPDGRPEQRGLPVLEGPPDVITPEDARSFWHGLRLLSVPPARWSRDYYRGRMDYAYEVLRGRGAEGVSMDGTRPLSPEQAAFVVRLFSEWLDPGDARLDVPRGRDYLASSEDGGYEWCEKCGAVDPNDVPGCRRRACPILAERDAEEPERARRWVLKDLRSGRYLGRDPGEWRPSVDRRARRFAARADAQAWLDRRPGWRRGRMWVAVVPVRRR